MKHRIGTRTLTLLFTIALALGLMLGMSMTAFADSSSWTSGNVIATLDGNKLTVAIPPRNSVILL